MLTRSRDAAKCVPVESSEPEALIIKMLKRDEERAKYWAELSLRSEEEFRARCQQYAKVRRSLIESGEFDKPEWQVDCPMTRIRDSLERELADYEAMEGIVP